MPPCSPYAVHWFVNDDCEQAAILSVLNPGPGGPGFFVRSLAPPPIPAPPHLGLAQGCLPSAAAVQCSGQVGSLFTQLALRWAARATKVLCSALQGYFNPPDVFAANMPTAADVAALVRCLSLWHCMMHMHVLHRLL